MNPWDLAVVTLFTPFFNPPPTASTYVVRFTGKGVCSVLFSIILLPFYQSLSGCSV